VPDLKTKSYRNVCRGENSINRVWYYARLQAAAGDLGRYSHK